MEWKWSTQIKITLKNLGIWKLLGIFAKITDLMYVNK